MDFIFFMGIFSDFSQKPAAICRKKSTLNAPIVKFGLQIFMEIKKGDNY